MNDALTPEGFTALRRQQLLDLKSEEFRLWQHHPITAAYLQWLDDLIADWRNLAADLVEVGAFQDRAAHEDRNPDVVRGRILAIRFLRNIELETIQGFYAQEPEVIELPSETDLSQDD